MGRIVWYLINVVGWFFFLTNITEWSNVVCGLVAPVAALVLTWIDMLLIVIIDGLE